MSGPTVSPDGWRRSSLSAAAGDCVEFVGGVRNAEFEV
ncbi:DUF397 domain-containing protein [Nonomuraea sp. NPDC001023]